MLKTIATLPRLVRTPMRRSYFYINGCSEEAAMMRILMPRAMAAFFLLLLFSLSCIYLLVNVAIGP